MTDEVPATKLSYTCEQDVTTETVRCRLPKKDYRTFATAPPPSRIEFEVVADEPAADPQTQSSTPTTT